MSDTDKFARLLLEEAKRFLERASREDREAKTAYLHASLLLSFSALEAHINCISDDFLVRPELSTLERSILAEREIELSSGEFVLKENLKIFRLEDRIEFLYRRFSGKSIDKTTSWWSDFKEGLKLRNTLTHPKGVSVVAEAKVKKTVLSILELLNAIYLGIYKTPYPPKIRGLDSTMTF
jgi:hypothetical protein